MKNISNVRLGGNLESYLNAKLDTTFNSVMVPMDLIRPSEYDGFTLEEENNFRLFGCELIQEGGIMLKQPQVTMITAMDLFHRFYFRKSFLEVDLRQIVAACMFLAMKLEETPKKIRDVVSVFDYLYKKKDGVPAPIPVLDLNSNEFMILRQELINAERFILKEVGFALTHLNVKPFKYLFYYAKLLKLNKVFVQKAWNYINDFYRIPICTAFPPHCLAVAAIWLTSRMLDYPLPDVEWYIAFDCTLETIEDIASEILQLYKMKKVPYSYIKEVIRRLYVPPVQHQKLPTPHTRPDEEEKNSPKKTVAQEQAQPTPIQPKVQEKKSDSKESEKNSESKSSGKHSGHSSGHKSDKHHHSHSDSSHKKHSRHHSRSRRDRGDHSHRHDRKSKSHSRDSSSREKHRKIDESKESQEPMQDTEIHYNERLEKERSKEDYYEGYLRLSKQKDNKNNGK